MKYFKSINEFLFFGQDKISANPEEVKLLKPIKIGSQGEDVKKLQESLENLGFRLNRFGVDSKFGAETLGQTKSLLYLIETNKDLHHLVSGYLDIDNNTVTPDQQSIIHQLSENDEAKNLISKHFEKLMTEIGDDTKLIGKDLINKHIEDPEEFEAKLIEICKNLQINPNFLILVMIKESRINPKAVNKTSHATGLIQFLPSTAHDLGTSVEELKNMPGTSQLFYVDKYLHPFIGKIHSVEDLYLAVFYPAALGKSDEDTIGGKKVAEQNPVIDLNHDKQITVGEFKKYVKKDIPSDLKSGLEA